LDLAGPLSFWSSRSSARTSAMAAARMGNFGLTRLRIVNPRDGWPNVHAGRAASGADHILDQVELFDTVEQAAPTLPLLFATTARSRHDQAKPVVARHAGEIGAEISGELVGIPLGPRALPASERKVGARHQESSIHHDRATGLRSSTWRRRVCDSLEPVHLDAGVEPSLLSEVRSTRARRIRQPQCVSANSSNTQFLRPGARSATPCWSVPTATFLPHGADQQDCTRCTAW